MRKGGSELKFMLTYTVMGIRSIDIGEPLVDGLQG
jgi:hypothetical protein